MRNEDLKNKLDQRPIDFDREALWERIESQPERKKRAAIWRFFGIALVIISFMLGSMYLPKSEELPQSLASSVEVEKAFRIDKLETVSMIQDDKSEEFKEVTSTNIKISKIDYQVTMEASSKKQNLTEQRSIDESSVPQFTEFITGSNVDESIYGEYAKKENVYSTTITTYEIENVIHGSGRDLNWTKVDLDQVQFLKTLGLSYLRPTILNTQDNFDFVIINASTPDNKHKNGFAIVIGVGSDLHRFEGDSKFRRQQIESNLESLTAQVSYQRYLSNKWSVSLGVRYTTSQTLVELTSLDIDQYTRSLQDGNTYIVTTETNRSLYNRYSRLDADLSLGYSWTYNDWIFTPQVGRGMNLKFDFDGDIITLDNEALALDEIGIYKDRLNGYWSTGMKIDRKFGDGLRLGLLASLQSSRNLTSFDHRHSMTPISLGLQIEWLW